MVIATADIYLNPYQADQNGRYPVSIKVYHRGDRRRRYYSTKYSVTKEQYSKMLSDKPGKELRNIKMIIDEQVLKANNIINDLKSNFTWVTFEKKFSIQRGDEQVLSKRLIERAIVLKKQGRIATATNIECARKSIISFSENGENTLLQDLTVSFFEKYENEMLLAGRSKTTIGMYLREVRTIVKQAIREGDYTVENYPFGVGKYQIPTGKNIKKAITLTEVGKIFHYLPASEQEEKARDFWVFSYLANGLNIKDFVLLRWDNIISDQLLAFQRVKTERTKRGNPALIKVSYTKEMKRIIGRWGTRMDSKDDFIFPILKKGYTPKELYNEKQLLVKFINTYMKRIANKLGIDTNLTTYVARHTHATVLSQSGASLLEIRDRLGHSSLKTTENYIAGLTDTLLHKRSSVLTDFNSVQEI